MTPPFIYFRQYDFTSLRTSKILEQWKKEPTTPEQNEETKAQYEKFKRLVDQMETPKTYSPSQIDLAKKLTAKLLREAETIGGLLTCYVRGASTYVCRLNLELPLYFSNDPRLQSHLTYAFIMADDVEICQKTPGWLELSFLVSLYDLPYKLCGI